MLYGLNKYVIVMHLKTKFSEAMFMAPSRSLKFGALDAIKFWTKYCD